MKDLVKTDCFTFIERLLLNEAVTILIAQPISLARYRQYLPAVMPIPYQHT